MIAVIDYKVGNLFSLTGSLRHLGEDAVVTSSADVLRQADKLILPGVGAFRDARGKLDDTGLIPVIMDEVAKGKPLLGICLGMQMLFDKSFEYGVYEGLGLIKGSVVALEGKLDKAMKIPHIGWNALNVLRSCPLTDGLGEAYVYYVHSYYAECETRYIVATSEYGIDVPGVVQNGNVFGTQFHPEKSGSVGLKILKAFCTYEGR